MPLVLSPPSPLFFPVTTPAVISVPADAFVFGHSYEHRNCNGLPRNQENYLWILHTDPMSIHCDSTTKVFYEGTKHTETDCYFVRDELLSRDHDLVNGGTILSGNYTQDGDSHNGGFNINKQSHNAIDCGSFPYRY
ncbi:hypothetical protein DM860_002545 [Cuscuta australis]|uniref:Uncharacterized protein n=1 Tax=Cuscuta australis TaxID=267555 RepID=A0A328CYK7_9ASTE|nr:hypothetical protein DM860_002545 [Cuscuta australis]